MKQIHLLTKYKSGTEISLLNNGTNLPVDVNN